MNAATKSEHPEYNFKWKRSANNKKRERTNKGGKIVVIKVRQLHYAQPTPIK